MEQVPVVTGIALLLLTVQIERELLVSVTASPDDALAVRLCSASVANMEAG